MPTVITDPTQIERFRVRALRSLLHLQSKGIGRRGRSALSIIRAEFPQVTARTAAAALVQFDALHPPGSFYGKP